MPGLGGLMQLITQCFHHVPGLELGEPVLPVAPEVESNVLGGPEGISLKSQETQGGCPVSLSNSDFSTPVSLLYFLSHLPCNKVWTHA